MSLKGKGAPKTWWSVVIGTAAGLIMNGLLVLLFTKLILSGTLPVTLSAIAACASIAISVAVGCTLTLFRAKGRKLMLSLLSGGIYFVVIIVGNVLAFRGTLKGIWLTFAIVMGSSLLCGLIGARRRKARYHV